MSDRLAATPGQTIGPFFHYALPYERGDHLVSPGTPGAVRLHGTVYDGDGAPIPDALVEIRQADSAGIVPQVEGSLQRDGTTFTGWGRAATDTVGRYSFLTVEPGAEPEAETGTPFFAVAVFARGLLNRLFTRAYLPQRDETDRAADRGGWLAAVDADRRGTLLTTREDDGSLRFDIHLQGPHETVFLTFPGEQG